jgi:hypothetical protein
LKSLILNSVTARRLGTGRKNVRQPHFRFESSCAVAFVVAFLFVRHADAAFIITMQQVGTGLVTTGSGTINMSALKFKINTFYDPAIQAGYAQIGVGSLGSYPNVAVYTGITGPSSFGDINSPLDQGVTGCGDNVGISYPLNLFVPLGYVSGAPLSATDTFANATYSTLGITPGTYTWTWGSGATADYLALDIIAHAKGP